LDSRSIVGWDTLIQSVKGQLMPEDHAEYKQAEEQFEENKASNNSDVEMDADGWNEEI